jgi:hypothetical protein
MREISVLIVVLLFILAGGASLSIWGEAASCHSRADKMQVLSEYGPMQGCMVYVAGRWIEIDHVKVIWYHQ